MNHEQEESFKIIRTFVKDFDISSPVDIEDDTEIPLVKLVDAFLTITENLETDDFSEDLKKNCDGEKEFNNIVKILNFLVS